MNAIEEIGRVAVFENTTFLASSLACRSSACLPLLPSSLHRLARHPAVLYPPTRRDSRPRRVARKLYCIAQVDDYAPQSDIQSPLGLGCAALGIGVLDVTILWPHGGHELSPTQSLGLSDSSIVEVCFTVIPRIPRLTSYHPSNTFRALIVYNLLVGAAESETSSTSSASQKMLPKTEAVDADGQSQLAVGVPAIPPSCALQAQFTLCDMRTRSLLLAEPDAYPYLQSYFALLQNRIGSAHWTCTTIHVPARRHALRQNWAPPVLPPDRLE
ncbi:hypothetical protein B0H14DRAFT_3665492 [Mycena olivaceomarginata]|nr:hypothetical protein B0H14DRAFT_3665492 [Mycena olivaceomarginata]